MYRIACVFEKDHPRMAGKADGKARISRGVWRVMWSRACLGWVYDYTVGAVDARYIVMPSAHYFPRGSLVNPRRVLAEFQAERRKGSL